MDKTGLTAYQNDIAKGCDIGSIARDGAAASAKLAIIYGAAATAAYFGGGAVAGSISESIPAVYAAGSEASAGESGIITGYIDHAIGRAAGTRSGVQMSPQAINSIVQNGARTYRAANDTYQYTHKLGTVSLNQAGKVVTVIAKSKLLRYLR